LLTSPKTKLSAFLSSAAILEVSGYTLRRLCMADKHTPTAPLPTTHEDIREEMKSWQE